MYGAILGDIIGSPFEFDRGDKVKDFELFSEGCNFTDDTVMTVAVAEALLAFGKDNLGIGKVALDKYLTNLEKKAQVSMQKWGNKYPYAGYGYRFRKWLKSEDPKPYGSYGNGSAMRTSAVGWLYNSLYKTRCCAVSIASITHNHPEGVKGAEATASAIYLARIGMNRATIKEYVEMNFGYDLDRTLDDIRPNYHHVETCQETVPEAIIAFLESSNFEDAIRNAVSLGGDTDTLAAITGSIAEAFYGVPEWLKVECRKRVDKNILKILDKFDVEKMNAIKNEDGSEYYLLTRHIPILEEYLLAKKQSNAVDEKLYARTYQELDAVVADLHEFMDIYPEYELTMYSKVLGEYGLDGEIAFSKDVDYTRLEKRAILALMVYIHRSHHFSDWAPWVKFALEDGSMYELLLALKGEVKHQDNFVEEYDFE